MSRRLASPQFGRLAMLQDLAALERRRTLESAFAETDRRITETKALAQELSAAESMLEQLYAKDRLCLDRLRLAAWIVGDNERALRGGEVALNEAKSNEREIGLQWMAARHRTEWFSNRARAMQKKEASKRDEMAEGEARSLRLALRSSLE